MLVLSPLVSPPSSWDPGSNAEGAGSRSRKRLLAAVWHHALDNYPGLFCRVIPGVDMLVAGVSWVLNSLSAHDENKFPLLSLCQGAPRGSSQGSWVIQTSGISGTELLTSLFMMVSSS